MEIMEFGPVEERRDNAIRATERIKEGMEVEREESSQT